MHEPSGSPRVAIVAAGAGARGAYEAGALSVLVPALWRRGRRPTVFVGTSAGAINATVLAASAHVDEPDEMGRRLLTVWRFIEQAMEFGRRDATNLMRTARDPFLSPSPAGA